MNRASRYLANARLLAFSRAVIVAFWICVCLCHQTAPSEGKVFEQCELAQLLRYGHGLDVDEVAHWVCIAQHSSSLNTSAFGGNARSGSHGLFQINDQYWCSPPGKGVACGVSCDRLRDDDIADDLECVRVIYNEHQRLSGDGFKAWNAYEQYCRENPYEYVEDCFGAEEREYLHSKSITANSVVDDEEEEYDLAPHKRGKVYSRCELAKELFLKHKMPMEDIPTWVCIAQHESNYDTSAVGRLNADGSADHGLFQISDLYWCSHKGGRRKACGISCNKLLDSDITDDVKCVKQIFKEHTRISGNGFTAWTVYNAYCNGNMASYVRGCFDGIDVDHITKSEEYQKYQEPPKRRKQKPQGKVYEPCELANELRNKHQLPEDQIATWVCIAQHESSYNTSAIGQENHGLFQISDLYWCSPPGRGLACGISCDELEDSDITDDVECIRTIYDEHTRLSGDGFNAWSVYPRFCSNGRAEEYIAHCPTTQTRTYTKTISANSIEDYQRKKGKKYDRCELAKELLTKHDMSMEDIPTWVCIAQHESNYDTSAVGRLNADGSADHGLFQISDLYWCSHKEGHKKACGLPCSKLLDNDISDDVKCVKQIYNEHSRISGNGFTAWTVYNAFCREKVEHYIRGCFDGTYSEEDFSPRQKAISTYQPSGKVYEECELAKELQNRHHVPKEQIPTWVCIAKHQSGLDTSSSLSNVHGLFHISDEYWCSPPGKGKACGVSCAELEDSDISDDVECVMKIYEEHQGLSGNGFNAWTAYNRHCSNGRANEFVSKCPGFESVRSYFGVTQSLQKHNYGIPGRGKPKGKVYGECELANELQNQHNLPKDQVPVWVCIAKHQSGLDTSSAVSNVHGLFHISDEFWCSPPGSGKACGVSCADLEDSDIRDDVECVKRIFEEHQGLSGNGFNAWGAYSRYCSNGRANQYVANCPGFQGVSAFFSSSVAPHRHAFPKKNVPKGKVYEECELARELRDKHSVSKEVVPTWICIAKHQSGLDTSSSVSNVHGLFHISDEFWCSPPGKGKGCELSCSDLEDSDISDDLQCVARIFDEHQRLFGNGFNAWTAYSQFCSNGRADEYVSNCPEFATSRRFFGQQSSVQAHPTQRFNSISLNNKPVYQHTFSDNVFLKHFDLVNSEAVYQLNSVTPSDTFSASEEVDNFVPGQTVFSLNPFLKHLISETEAPSPDGQTQQFAIETATSSPAFNVNPFLKHLIPNTGVSSQEKFSIRTTTAAPAFLGIPITPTPTTSSRFGTYQPQDEERAKLDAFRTFASPTISISTQTPRANRLQTYQLNTFKTVGTPTLPTATSLTSIGNRVQPYQLNTFRSGPGVTTTPTVRPPITIQNFRTISQSLNNNIRTVSTPLNTINQFRTISTPTTQLPSSFGQTHAVPSPTIQPLNTIHGFKFISTPTGQPLNTVNYYRTTSTPTTHAPITISNYRTVARPTTQTLNAFKQFSTISTPTTQLPSTRSKIHSVTSPTIQPLNTIHGFKFISTPTGQPLNTVNYYRTTSTPTTHAPITISNYRTVARPTTQTLNAFNQFSTISTPTTQLPSTTSQIHSVTSPTIQPLNTIHGFKFISPPTRQPLNTVSYYRTTSTPTTHAPVTISNYRTISRPTVQSLNTRNQFSTTIQPLSSINSNRNILTPTTPAPSTVSYFQTTTPRTTPSQSTSSFFRNIVSPTTPTTITFPTRSFPTVQAKVSVYRPTTKSQFTSQDTGRYDSGRYDPGRYDSGRYNSNAVSSSTTTTTIRPSTFSAGQYHIANPTVSVKSQPNVRITTTGLSGQHDPFRQSVTTFNTQQPFSSSIVPTTTTSLTRHDAFRSFVTPTVRPVTTSFTTERDTSQYNAGNYYSTPSLPTTVGLRSTTLSPTTQAFFASTTKPYDPFAPYKFGRHTSNPAPFSFLSGKSVASNELDYELSTNTKRETVTTRSKSVSLDTMKTTALRPVPTAPTRSSTAHAIPSKSIASTTVKPAPTRRLTTKSSVRVTSTTTRRPVTKPTSKSGSAGQPIRSTSTTKPVSSTKSTSTTSSLFKTTIQPTAVKSTLPTSLKPTTNAPTHRVKSLNPSTTRPTTTRPPSHQRPSGSLFTPKQNIFDLYYKLYGISPPSLKTSSSSTPQPTQIHVATSRTS